MRRVVVSDTSPLSYLILTHVVDFLPRLFTQVFIPPAVDQELSSVQSPLEIREWIAHPPVWLKLATPTRAPNNLGLDLGETQAIWLGEELGVKSILIDERKGSRVARQRGFRVVGTLTLITQFAEEGWIDFEEVISRLRLTKFRYREELITEMRVRLNSKHR